MLFDYELLQIVFIGLIFLWTGFVRTGLGFGGAALGLPLLLFIDDRPLLWLPVIGLHLLFFSGLTLRTRLHDVDWRYLRQASCYVLPGALVGVFGLLTLPNQWLVIFIYSITLFYAVIWIANLTIQSRNDWLDRFLLVTGGYVAGTSLSGAPLMVAVFMRKIARHQLRNTLFVLWFILVSLKLSALLMLGVDLQVSSAVLLLPVAAIGHVAGLKVHERILQNDQRFKQVIGGVLIVICVLGFINL